MQRNIRNHTMRKHIGERLKQIRQQSGKTQTQLAVELHTTKGNISSIEHCRNVPTLANILRYATACGYDVEINFVPIGQAADEFCFTIADKKDLRLK